MKSKLGIRDYVIPVHLGCGEPERAVPQAVHFDFTFEFERPPAACESDRLEETIDYGKVAEIARKTIDGREFKTIEYLGHELLQGLRRNFPAPQAIEVAVRKVHAPVENLQGGSWFRISDGPS